MSDTPTSDPFHLRIEIGDPARLEALQRMFAALARIKEIQFGPEDADDSGWIEDEDPRWYELLDEGARRHFAGAFDHDSEEGRVFDALWSLTSPSKRRDPIFNPPGPWPFGAVIAAIYRGEYLLTELVRVDETTAVLRYDPQAGPFGGTEGMVGLVEAFGHRVVHDSWHQGPHHRETVGWDYERAKALVARGRGVE